MPKKRAPYHQEFRDKIIALVFSSRSFVELTIEFELSKKPFVTCFKQAKFEREMHFDGLRTKVNQEFRQTV